MELKVFVFLFSIVFFAFWLTNRILKRLEESYNDLYVEMGSPALIMNNTPRTMMAFQKFVMSRRFKRLEEKDLKVKCEILFWLQVAWLPILFSVAFLIG